MDWTYFEVELYAHLAEHAPDMLVGPWRLLDELIRLEERYWFCNSSTPGELGDGAAQENCSHLDLDALHADWHALKERVWVVS